MRIEQPEIPGPNVVETSSNDVSCHDNTRLLSQELRVFPAISERVPVIGCYSEVMMHFGLAGRPIEISLEYQYVWHQNRRIPKPEWGVTCQVWKDGHPFSSPILPSEGGFYEAKVAGHETQKGEYGYYTYMRRSEEQGDAEPTQVKEELIQMLKEAISSPDVRVLTNFGL